MPQGYVLDASLFVSLINSHPDSLIGSDVFLFEGDTKVFRSIFTESDCDVLQQDINNMVKLLPEKCAIMRVGKSELPERI